MLRIRASITGLSGGNALTTGYFTFDNLVTEARDQFVAFWTSVATRMRSSCVVTLDTAGAVLDPADGDQIAEVSLAAFSVAGGQNDDLLPSATQGLVNWRTNDFVDGRRVRGRTFIPGLTEGASGLSGTLTGTSLTTIQTAATAYADAAGNPAVVWHRPSAEGPGSIHNIVTATVGSKFAVLRSRRD